MLEIDKNSYAYKAGFSAFYAGSRQDVAVPDQLGPLVRSYGALVTKPHSRQTKAALYSIMDRLKQRGYGVSLQKSKNGQSVQFYKIVEPVCPFSPNSLYAKEWQRGFNAAYFQNKATLS